MTAASDIAPRISCEHRTAIRKLIRVLIREESACRVLAHHEEEFRDFPSGRTMQQAIRINNAEIEANRIRDEVIAAMEAWFQTTDAEQGAEHPRTA